MAEQLVPPVLSTPDANLFEEPTTIKPARDSQLSPAELRDVYEIERTAREIIQGGWMKIALQFPDGMLMDAPGVYEALEKALQSAPAREEKMGLEEEVGTDGKVLMEAQNQKSTGPRRRLYILADTSYGSCCVDEIAAEHVDAEVVVHYGRACLSPTARLPVIYIYTTRPLDSDAMIQAFEENFSKSENEKIVLMADLTYHSHLLLLLTKLRKLGWENVRSTDVIHDPSAPIPNRKILFHAEEEKEDLQDWKIWHISDPPAALLLILSSKIKELVIYPTSGTEKASKANTAIQLRRRYALLTRITTTPIIGILINTLSVANYLSSNNALKALIDKVGKKSYTFVVGKVNTAKIANFGEVGGWVVVGCWESSLIEASDFYTPVVTPFELGLALQRDKDRVWDGEWKAGFDDVLPKISAQETAQTIEDEGTEADQNEDGDSEEESAPPEFDLRTGRYVSHSRPMHTSSTTPSQSSQPSSSNPAATQTLARRAKLDVATVNGVVSPGAEFLRSQRTWTGLGSDFNEQSDADVGGHEGATVEEGRSGIARGYVVGDHQART